MLIFIAIILLIILLNIPDDPKGGGHIPKKSDRDSNDPPNCGSGGSRK